MRVFVFSCLITAVLCLSSTALTYIRIFGIGPDLMLLIIVSYAVLRGDVEGAVLGFAAGLLKDIFFGDIIGLSAMLYAVIGYISGKPFKDFFPENHFLPLIISCLGALLYETAFYFFTYLFRGETDIWYYMNRRILPAALYTAVFAIPVYRLIYFINARLELWDRPKNRFS